MMEIKKTEFGELRVWAPYNRDFDKKIKAAGGQIQEMPGKTQSWVVPEEVKINTIRKYMYESYGRSDLDDEREELLTRLADIEDQMNKIKEEMIMEKRDVFGNPVILDEERKEGQKGILLGELHEMFALGWRDTEARADQEAFFERIGEDYAGGLTEEDVWAVWGSVLEYEEEAMRDLGDSEEKIAAIMSGDDEALADIEAREHEKKHEALMKDLEGDIDLG